jgi:hypothetical protein
MTANAVASQLMYLQTRVFGDTTFLLKDSRLFNYTNSSGISIKPKFVTIHPKKVQNAPNMLASITYTECYTQVYDGDQGQLVGVEPGGTNDYSYSETICYTTTIWFDDSGGSSSGGTTDGGTTGGGGGSYTDPYSDPCAKISGARLAPEDDPCGGDLGWEPVPVDEPTSEIDANGYYYSRITELQSALQQDPYFLMPCKYLNQFYGIGNFKAPEVVLSRIDQLNSDYNAYNGSFIDHPFQDTYYWIQDVNDATGTVVNCDYFPVHISTLPTIGGVQWTAEQLFDYFRKNMNQFLNTSIASFYPYQDALVDDISLWNSSNPLTSLLHLDMTPYDGSVIISDFQTSPTKSSFTVSTILTPLDRLHPVSGNRSWGIMQDAENGGYNFYVTAVDRVTKKINEDIGDIIDDFGGSSGFDLADALWRSLQDKMIAFINANNGLASKYSGTPEIILRPSYSFVRDYLTGVKTLAELRQALGCP